ncbi:hypothetical protein CEUSTIGMA_g552.t1 [Chlamydomonas eustigma]|uniref:Uncharacterized protein n=1 Tax=Chlamydomonas eustigma TaxID=1157962 RepID=A0A250WQX8_9CHLO|nr:hypothetical protein CEUSTIGMA_g552.t1 [Chlamydomonas eustigma]|eukprot:GAX73099.1 hypothetical protein CEUSTIGMA_g552.t1 [Chlamydomonas eustigma]
MFRPFEDKSTSDLKRSLRREKRDERTKKEEEDKTAGPSRLVTNALTSVLSLPSPQPRKIGGKKAQTEIQPSDEAGATNATEEHQSHKPITSAAPAETVRSRPGSSASSRSDREGMSLPELKKYIDARTAAVSTNLALRIADLASGITDELQGYSSDFQKSIDCLYQDMQESKQRSARMEDAVSDMQQSISQQTSAVVELKDQVEKLTHQGEKAAQAQVDTAAALEAMKLAMKGETDKQLSELRSKYDQEFEQIKSKWDALSSPFDAHEPAYPSPPMPRDNVLYDTTPATGHNQLYHTAPSSFGSDPSPSTSHSSPSSITFRPQEAPAAPKRFHQPPPPPPQGQAPPQRQLRTIVEEQSIPRMRLGIYGGAIRVPVEASDQQPLQEVSVAPTHQAAASHTAQPPRPPDYGHELSVGPATSLGYSSLRYGPDSTASLDPKFHLDPKSIPTFTAKPGLFNQMKYAEQCAKFVINFKADLYNLCPDCKPAVEQFLHTTALTPGSFAVDSNAQSVLSIVQKLKASRSTKGDDSYAPYPPGPHQFPHAWILVTNRYLGKPLPEELSVWTSGLTIGLPNKLHPQVSPDENPEAFGSRVFHSYEIFRASGSHLFTDLLHEFSIRRVLLSGLRQYQSVLHDVLCKVGVQSTSEEDILARIVVAAQNAHEFEIAQKTSRGFYPPTGTQPGQSATPLTPPAGALPATHSLRSPAPSYAPAPSYNRYPPRRAPAPAAHVTVLEDSPPIQDSPPYFTPDDEAQEFSGFSPPSHPSPAVVDTLTTYPATMHPRGNNRAPLPTTVHQQSSGKPPTTPASTSGNPRPSPGTTHKVCDICGQEHWTNLCPEFKTAMAAYQRVRSSPSSHKSVCLPLDLSIEVPTDDPPDGGHHL